MAPLASPPALSRSGTGPAEATDEVLRRIQLAMSLPAQPLPLMQFQDRGDPALEPLKNLLMFLLRPSFGGDAGAPALADLLARAAAQAETPAGTRPGAGPGSASETGPQPHASPALRGDPSGTREVASKPAPSAEVRGEPTPRTTNASTSGSAAVRPGSAEPAAFAKSWESWLSEGVRTLSDPQSSPREAPFHLAQAREGTAFFELPLPWEGKVLQMWVEEDAEGDSRGKGEGTRRVLVGLHFSALGETRVGLVQAADRLQVRVWAEHPEVLRTQEDALRSSLADLGPGLDFQVLPLGEPGAVFPSLRALAAGNGFNALG